MVNKNNIIETLKNFNIICDNVNEIKGPSVITFELDLNTKTKLSQLSGIERDLALQLSVENCHITTKTSKVCIQISNPNKTMVEFDVDILKSASLKMQLPIYLGKDAYNEKITTDLTKMPHLLIAGATGQGKSVGLNVIVSSLIESKSSNDLKLVLIDPKRVEFAAYNKATNYLYCPVITESEKAIEILDTLCFEMDNRYNLLQDAGCKNITEYNQKVINLNEEIGHKHLPYIVTIIDEFADLMLTGGKDAEKQITRLAQLSRAVGIHLIVATQRPSTNIITGSIKANFPARIAYKVASAIDSRTILNSKGAEALNGCGDMLFSNGIDTTRIQSAFISDEQIETIISK